jgi:hypothetical protein
VSAIRFPPRGIGQLPTPPPLLLLLLLLQPLYPVSSHRNECDEHTIRDGLLQHESDGKTVEMDTRGRVVPGERASPSWVVR